MKAHIKNPPPTLDMFLTWKEPTKVKQTPRGTKTTKCAGGARIVLRWDDGAYYAPCEISSVPFRLVAIPVVDLPGSHDVALFPNQQQFQLDKLRAAFEAVNFTGPLATRIDPFICQVFLLPTPRS